MLENSKVTAAMQAIAYFSLCQVVAPYAVVKCIADALVARGWQFDHISIQRRKFGRDIV
jgi:hypothetical protein